LSRIKFRREFRLRLQHNASVLVAALHPGRNGRLLRGPKQKSRGENQKKKSASHDSSVKPVRRGQLWKVRLKFICVHLRQSAASFATGCSALQQLPGNHQPLDLAGSFADGAQLDVAIKLFTGLLLDY